MSRQDDAAITGQGTSETPKADGFSVIARTQPIPIKNPSGEWVPLYLARDLQRELNQAINENKGLKTNRCTCHHPCAPGGICSECGYPIRGEDLGSQLDKAINERDELKLSLRTLISLHEWEIETGEPISGADWAMAGNALNEIT